MPRALILKLVAASCCLLLVSCGGENVPETDYPLDSQTGYQPGGGMMPTFAPAENLVTLSPSE